MIRIDQKLDKAPTEDMSLSVIVHPDSLQYALLDSDGCPVSLFDQKMDREFKGHRIDSTIEYLIQSNRFESSFVSKVKIALNTRDFVLVPETLIDEKDLNQYFEDISYVGKTDLILANRISKLDSRYLYTLSGAQTKGLKSKFPNADIYHYGYILLEQSLKLINEIPYKDVLMIFAKDSRAYAALFKQGTLQLYNHFWYDTQSDLLYFLALYLKQYELKRAQTHIYLAGELTQDGSYYSYLKTFLPNLHFVHNAHLSKYSDMDKNFPDYYFFDLFALEHANH